MKTNKRQSVIIGISSGIAGYRIVDLIKILKDGNIDVKIILTKNAKKMFGKEMFEKSSENKVYTTLFPKSFDYREVLKKREVEHIKIADKASLFVIAPATANIIGKIANGLADDFLTTTLLAATAPILLCPSMNPHMWGSPIVQENLSKLKRLGYYILSPQSGRLACGDDGIGRLPDMKIIAKEIFHLLDKRSGLTGQKIIVTAGGTSEPIDAVRVIANKASGKMGVSIAEECYLQGAEVLLLRAKNSVSAGLNIKEEIFETAKDLLLLIEKHVKQYDALFHTAAVADFLPEKKYQEKIDSNSSLRLKLIPTPKILHMIKSWNPKILLIGFKAVYNEKEKDLVRIGIDKLKESRSDYIIVNDVGKEGIGFGSDENEVYIIADYGLMAKIKQAPKREIARKILKYILG